MTRRRRRSLRGDRLSACGPQMTFTLAWIFCYTKPYQVRKSLSIASETPFTFLLKEKVTLPLIFKWTSLMFQWIVVLKVWKLKFSFKPQFKSRYHSIKFSVISLLWHQFKFVIMSFLLQRNKCFFSVNDHFNFLTTTLEVCLINVPITSVSL
jgi:hypothetical protein